MTYRSLTGDERTDAVVPAATRLIWAVREWDAAGVDTALNEVATAVGGAGVAALVVVLAAMVSDDESPGHLLAWLEDPERYREMRLHGYSAAAAIRALHQEGAA